jgi:hypothetical protein
MQLLRRNLNLPVPCLGHHFAFGTDLERKVAPGFIDLV